MVSALIDKGANVLAQDKNGKTFSEIWYLESVESMLFKLQIENSIYAVFGCFLLCLNSFSTWKFHQNRLKQGVLDACLTVYKMLYFFCFTDCLPVLLCAASPDVASCLKHLLRAMLPDNADTNVLNSLTEDGNDPVKKK